MSMGDRARWAFAIVFDGAAQRAGNLEALSPVAIRRGYLARWYEPYLVPSRAVAYGLILNAGVPLSFWPVVLGQSALTVWVIALTMRVHSLGGRPELLAGIVVALSAFSTLPWLPRSCSRTFSPGSRCSHFIFSCFAQMNSTDANKPALLP